MIFSSNKKYYLGLDLVRFLAALLVTTFHLAFAIHVKNGRGAPLAAGLPRPSSADLFAWGHVGVQAFFVISGLVIANSAVRAAPYDFVRSRIERLYPAVWVCAPVSFACWLSATSVDYGDVTYRFFKTISLFPFSSWIDAPYWTLGHEIVFYAVTFIFISIFDQRKLEYFGYAISLFSSFFWFIYGLSEFHYINVPLIPLLSEGIGRMFLTYYGCFFALGMMLWVTSSKGFTAFRSIMLIMTYITCLISLCIEPILAGRNFIYELTCWIFLSILIIASTYGDLSIPSLSIRQMIRKIGLMTYPLYLIHFALGIVLIRWIYVITDSIELATCIAVLTLIGLSWLISTYCEPRIRNVIRSALAFAELEASIIRTKLQRLRQKNA